MTETTPAPAVTYSIKRARRPWQRGGTRPFVVSCSDPFSAKLAHEWKRVDNGARVETVIDVMLFSVGYVHGLARHAEQSHYVLHACGADRRFEIKKPRLMIRFYASSSALDRTFAAEAIIDAIKPEALAALKVS
jgi:hypothetical protein